MASFAAYNTDDPNAPAGAFPPAQAGQSIVIGPVMTGIAAKIAGSCYSDTAGTLLIQQTFDANTATDPETAFWDVVTSMNITAGTPVTIEQDVIAPWMQVTFTNGGVAQNHLRLFVRAFGNRVST